MNTAIKWIVAPAGSREEPPDVPPLRRASCTLLLSSPSPPRRLSQRAGPQPHLFPCAAPLEQEQGQWEAQREERAEEVGVHLCRWECRDKGAEGAWKQPGVSPSLLSGCALSVELSTKKAFFLPSSRSQPALWNPLEANRAC